MCNRTDPIGFGSSSGLDIFKNIRSKSSPKPEKKKFRLDPAKDMFWPAKLGSIPNFK